MAHRGRCPQLLLLELQSLSWLFTVNSAFTWAIVPELPVSREHAKSREQKTDHSKTCLKQDRLNAIWKPAIHQSS